MNYIAPLFVSAALLCVGCGDGKDPAAPQSAPAGGASASGGTSGGTSPAPPAATGDKGASIKAESLYPLMERMSQSCGTITEYSLMMASGKSLDDQESAKFNAARRDQAAVFTEICEFKRKYPRAKPRLREAFDTVSRANYEKAIDAANKLAKAISSKKAGSAAKDPELDDPKNQKRLVFEMMDATSTFGTMPK
ncbi:MAG: hypothetical protein O2800_03565 [Planctomycetota bacterium]|nr:hypothetical protein [Planctomycetota bacterium]